MFALIVVETRLETSRYFVGEGMGSVTICAILNRAAETSVEVTLSTFPDTAEGMYFPHSPITSPPIFNH